MSTTDRWISLQPAAQNRHRAPSLRASEHDSRLWNHASLKVRQQRKILPSALPGSINIAFRTDLVRPLYCVWESERTGALVQLLEDSLSLRYRDCKLHAHKGASIPSTILSIRFVMIMTSTEWEYTGQVDHSQAMNLKYFAHWFSVLELPTRLPTEKFSCLKVVRQTTVVAKETVSCYKFLQWF